MYEFDEHPAGSRDSALDLYVFLQRHLSKQRTRCYERRSRFEVLHFLQVQLLLLEYRQQPRQISKYS